MLPAPVFLFPTSSVTGESVGKFLWVSAGSLVAFVDVQSEKSTRVQPHTVPGQRVLPAIIIPTFFKVQLEVTGNSCYG